MNTLHFISNGEDPYPNRMGICIRYKTPIISKQNFVLKSINEIKIGIIKKLKLEGNYNVFYPIFNLFLFFLTSFPSFLSFLPPFWLLSWLAFSNLNFLNTTIFDNDPRSIHDEYDGIWFSPFESHSICPFHGSDFITQISRCTNCLFI